METISPGQLRKYQSILNEIDSEFKKNKKLKKQIEFESDKLTAVRIAMQENITQSNIFHVLVKLFHNIYDIFYLYNEDISASEFERLGHHSNCKFYLVKLYISKNFFDKISALKWWLNISVKNSRSCIIKGCRVDAFQMFVVIPFDLSVDPAIIDIKLYANNSGCVFKIARINVDISYHFASNLQEERCAFLQLLEHYNANSKITSQQRIEYKLKCKCTQKHFFEAIVKNCYHSLNPDIFLSLSDEFIKKPSVGFCIGINALATIELDKARGLLKLSSDFNNLVNLKKYFIGETASKDVWIDKMWLLDLSNLKQYLRNELGKATIGVDNIKDMYEELQKLLFDLPL